MLLTITINPQCFEEIIVKDINCSIPPQELCALVEKSLNENFNATVSVANLEKENKDLKNKLYSLIFIEQSPDIKAGTYRVSATLTECISIALDALNFACGSDNREIYKCCATAIRQIMDKMDSASVDAVKEKVL